MTPYSKILVGVSWCFIVSWFCGCGSGIPRGAVRGKITLDGQPVEKGTINFVPLARGYVEPAWAMVNNGDYAIPLSTGPAVGEYRIEIRWPRATGRQFPALHNPNVREDEMLEAIPPKYNSRSTLTAEIELGENERNFELISK